MFAAALPLLAAAAAVGGGQASFDLKCVVASSTAMENSAVKPELKVLMMSAVTYYTGRVDAEIPAAELEERLVETGKSIEGQQVASLLKDCGEFMTRQGKIWTDVGERLKAREAEHHT